VGLVGLIWPETAVYLLLISIPVQDLGALPVTGTNITANKVATGLAAAVFALGFLASRLKPQAPRAALAPLLAYLSAMWASMLVARSIGASMAEIYRWLQFLLVVLLALATLRWTRQWIVVAVIAVLSGAVEGSLGIYQFVTGAGPESFAITEKFSRAFGTFGMPNSYAGYLAQIFPLSLALLVGTACYLMSSRSRGHRLPVLALWACIVAASSLTLGGLVAAYSRGAWLGTLAALAVMVLAVSRRLFLGTAVVLALTLGLVWLQGPPLLPQFLGQRLASLTDQLQIFDVTQQMVTPANFAVAERMSQWQAGINMFQKNPILGVGIGNYSSAYPDYFVGIWVFSRGHAHNYYINSAAETGVIGLAAYLWLLGYWLYSLASASRKQFGLVRSMAVGALGAVVAMSVHNLVDNMHVLSMGVYQGTLYAMGVALSSTSFGGKS
jgi:O-antigen ligase